MTSLQKGRLDPLLPLVAEVVDDILRSAEVVTPLEVLVRLEIVEPDQVEAWRRGALPYLERAITSGLPRVSRILRLLQAHAQSLGLTPTLGKYSVRGKGPRRALRFSRRGDPELELAYSTHFARAPVERKP